MMMGWLLLLAAAATDYGTSPLVQPGHAHRWLQAEDDDELTGWIDLAWRSETVIDEVRYKQVLLRTATKGDDSMVVDILAAVDCERAAMGMQRVVVIAPDVGDDAEVPIEGLDMEPLRTADIESDRMLFDTICGSGGTN